VKAKFVVVQDDVANGNIKIQMLFALLLAEKEGDDDECWKIWLSSFLNRDAPGEALPDAETFVVCSENGLSGFDFKIPRNL
jgi:hypothetical protein